MSAGGDSAPASDNELREKVRDAFRDFGDPRPFKAGQWISAPGRPLLGWYRIESGTVATADAGVADLARRGLVLERDDTFGEYSLIPEAQPFPSVLRALTDVETRFVKAESYPGAQGAMPELELYVRRRVTLNKHLASLVDALKRYPALELVPLYQLIKIAQRGEVSECAKGQTFTVSEDEIVFVASGELTVAKSVVLHTGSIFRPVETSGRDEDRQLIVREDACVIRIDWAKIGRSVPNYVRLSTAMSRRSTEKPEAEKPAPGILCAAAEPKRPTAETGIDKPVMVRVGSDVVDTPIAALCRLLVKTLQRDQPSVEGAPFAAVVLRVYPNGAPIEAKQKVGEVSWAVGTPHEELWIKGNAPHVAFIDDSLCRGSKERNQINACLAPSKLLYFCSDSREVPDELRSDTISVVRCVFLRNGDLSRFSSSSEPGRLFVAAYHPGAVRLRFDDLKSLDGKEFEELSDRDRRSLSRCGRALMERRVGLALGGGAAWGYAHIALIEALEEVRLPIDIVSGVSFGSLAGGFYAAGGLRLLYELVPRGTRLQLALLLTSMVPPLVHQYLTALLEDQMLEYLETPFFPVGLNLETGEEWSPASGPVSNGIRASSMLPGMFSPLLIDGVRAVDGVFVNNVPEGVLTRERADFIIASDVMQTPGNPYAQPPRFPSSIFQQFWRTLKSISPVSRMKDSMDATAFLTKIADERDKGLANKRFEPGRTGVAMWDFSKGNQIIDMARAKADEFAREAYKAWIELPTLRMPS